MLSEAFQIDHTVPLWKGGADEESNCSALCANCHAVKTQIEATERAAALERSNAEKTEKAKEELLRSEEKNVSRRDWAAENPRAGLAAPPTTRYSLIAVSSRKAERRKNSEAKVCRFQ